MTLLDDKALVHLRALGQEDWINKAQERVEIMCGLYGLDDLQPIHGGRSGVVARCVDSEGSKLILKIMLPTDLPGQAAALHSMQGKRAPKLAACEPEVCGLLLHDLDGWPQPLDQEVDLLEAAEILLSWQGLHPDPGLPNQYERVEYWAGLSMPRVHQIGDHQVEQDLGWAMEFSKHLPSGELLLHGDMGRHNLVYDAAGVMCAVDPLGAKGDLTYDAGSLAVWGGTSVINAPQRCLLLAEYLNRPLEEIEAWAAVRCALSAGFAAARGELNQRADCLHTMRELLG